MSEFHKLTVSKVESVTADSVAVSFDVPANLKETFQYKPGQFLTLRFDLNGQDVRRSYSLCSSPAAGDALRVGVKRVSGGLVSNHINDNVKPGTEIEVMTPDGRFCAEVSPQNYKTYYLFAAGSGITPIISIAKSVLSMEAGSQITLLYGNRRSQDVIFRDALAWLKNRYLTRFQWINIFSQDASLPIATIFRSPFSLKLE